MSRDERKRLIAPQLIFGGLIAIILLALYVWAIISGMCAAQTIDACHNLVTPFSANVQSFLNSVGGLISATVVGVLGATNASEFPGARLFKDHLTGTWQKIAEFMPSLYILVWIICGTFMVIYGYFLYPANIDPAPAFSAQAKVWLGTAIAAVYAYFGIRPGVSSANSNDDTVSVSKPARAVENPVRRARRTKVAMAK